MELVSAFKEPLIIKLPLSAALVRAEDQIAKKKVGLVGVYTVAAESIVTALEDFLHESLLSPLIPRSEAGMIAGGY